MNSQASALIADRFALFSKERHAAVRLSAPRRFPDTAGLNTIPLLVGEVSEAAAHFPIVFVGTDKIQLAAALAISSEGNLFLNPDGTWPDGVYTPALLRRRPFSIAPTDNPQRFAILLDEKDATLDGEKGAPLFDGDKTSALGEELLALTRELQPAAAATEAFIAAVQAQGLLASRTVTLTSGGRAPVVVQGVQLIDPDKLAALPESTIVEWHRNGYLAAIAYINGSQGRWQTLSRLARLRDEARANA